MYQLNGPRCGQGLLLAAIPASRLGVIVAIAILGGCAAADSPPSRVAGPPAQGIKVEIEDDGLPSQIALKIRRPSVDDPNEPWSPNYGSSHPVQPAASQSVERPGGSASEKQYVPAAVLASATRSPSLHPDDIIRQAVAEHEMRKR